MKIVHHLLVKNRGPMISPHVVSGPQTSFVATLYKVQYNYCMHAAQILYSVHCKLGVSENPIKMCGYLFIYLIFYCYNEVVILLVFALKFVFASSLTQGPPALQASMILTRAEFAKPKREEDPTFSFHRAKASRA